MAQTGVGAGSTATPGVVRIEDGTSTNLAVVSVGGALLVNPTGATGADNADNVTPVGTGLFRSASEHFAFDGTNFDRVRTVSGSGDGLGVQHAMQPSSTYGTATATNAAATVTFAAVAGQTHRLTSANVSYSNAIGAAAAASVTDNATNVLAWLGTNQPTGPMLPPGGFAGAAVNTTMAVALAGGGVTTTGFVLATKLTA